MEIKRTSLIWRLSSTLFFSIVAMAINYLISFLLTPYITTHIGTDAYGFVSLAKTIANYGIIITGCLNTYASRFITLAYHENDLKKATSYFSSVVIANLTLLISVLLMEVFFINNLHLFIKIPNTMIKQVKVLFALNITNYMLLALVNVFTVSAYIKNCLDKLEIIKVSSYVCEALVLFFLFKFFTPQVYYVGIGLIISTIVLGTGNYFLYKKETPELKIIKNTFSWSAVKDLVLSGMWNSINSIGNLLNSGLELLVSNLMLSATSMGELSIVKTVSTIITTLHSLVSRPFHPYLLKYYSKGQLDKVVQVFNFQIKISGFISVMVCSGLVCFGKVYYNLWTPNQNIQLLYGITVVTAVGHLFDGMSIPLLYTYTLTLKNKIPCIVTIISGCLNVVGMYFLLKYSNLGLYAVVGTTTALGFFTYLIFNPIYIAHCLKQKWTIFYNSIIRVMLSMVATTVVLKTIFVVLPKTWVGFIFCVLISCIIGLPIHMLCTLQKHEIKMLLDKIGKRGKKK